MSTRSALYLRGRNPDVLTSIANLSNDEVFTPPEFANQMLDSISAAYAAAHEGASIWEDKTVKFLDPFSKSGVFLREITRRLVAGLETQIPDLQDRVNHVLLNQVFGLSITELTSLLARRSVYCSKWANNEHSIATVFQNTQGNIKFERTEHTWVGGQKSELRTDANGETREVKVDGKCKFCKASQLEYERSSADETHAYGFIHEDQIVEYLNRLFGAEMKFDVVIGNPPYQLNDGGHSASATAIYHLFVEQALKLEPRFLSMVIPSRWFAGGKGLAEFRDKMLKDQHLRELHDFPSTTDVFPGVNVRGGVCYFLWDKSTEGPVTVSTYAAGALESNRVRPLLEPGASTFIRSNEGVDILRKVIPHLTGSGAANQPFPVSHSFSSLVSSRKPFGLDTTVIGKAAKGKGDLRLYRNGGVSWIAASKVTSGTDLIDQYKIFVPYASPGSDVYPHLLLSKPIIGIPGDVASETYLAIGPFPDEKTARNVARYMATTFFRFMLNLQRVSQHVTKSVYRFVPILDSTQSWDDSRLGEFFGLDDTDFEYMRRYIKDVAWAGDFE